MRHEWLLRRNCSLTPRQAGAAYGLLCAFLLAVGLAFTLSGFWIVIAFALAEAGVLVLALLHYARHATDHKRVALSDGCLLVERVEAGTLQQVRLDPCWTRIAAPGGQRSLIRLESRGVTVDIGRFIPDQARREVARELRRELARRSFLAMNSRT